MARVNVAITDEWQLVANTSAVFTVQSRGSSRLMFSNSPSDVGSISFTPEFGEQFYEDSEVDTYVRASTANDIWKLTVETEEVGG